jgi:hypothetical protein
MYARYTTNFYICLLNLGINVLPECPNSIGNSRIREQNLFLDVRINVTMTDNNPKPPRRRAQVNRRIVHDDNEGETFDLNTPDISSSSDEDLIQPTRARGGAATQPAALPASGPPSQTGSGSRGSRVAHDINYFFCRGDRRNKESSTVCVSCE